MSTFNKIIARGNAVLRSRDDGDDDGENDTVIDLMIAFLGLAFCALLLVGILLWLRRVKRQRMLRDDTLPRYNDLKHDNMEGFKGNRLTIQTADGRSSVLYLNNNRPMLADPASPPYSPTNIPEIHITFPDEHDDRGQRKSGRVLVVRVGDNATVGLEPMQHYEQLPAYEKEAKGQFYSLDMNEIGGLKEKNRSTFQ
jgi:hypothetical protein